MAFGVLSKEMLSIFGNKIFEILMANCVPKDEADKEKKDDKPKFGHVDHRVTNMKIYQ